jgi:hypothetical protein
VGVDDAGPVGDVGDAGRAPDSGTTGVEACAPSTCDARHYHCGDVNDGCGGLLHCGDCSAPDQCLLDTTGWMSCTTPDGGACQFGVQACTSSTICAGCVDPTGQPQAGTCGSNGTCCSEGPTHCPFGNPGDACGPIGAWNCNSTIGGVQQVCACAPGSSCDPVSHTCVGWWSQCQVAADAGANLQICYFSKFQVQWYSCASSPNACSQTTSGTVPPAPPNCVNGALFCP